VDKHAPPSHFSRLRCNGWGLVFRVREVSSSATTGISDFDEAWRRPDPLRQFARNLLLCVALNQDGMNAKVTNIKMAHAYSRSKTSATWSKVISLLLMRPARALPRNSRSQSSAAYLASSRPSSLVLARCCTPLRLAEQCQTLLVRQYSWTFSTEDFVTLHGSDLATPPIRASMHANRDPSNAVLLALC